MESTCPKCGAVSDKTGIEGLCPACVARMAFDSDWLEGDQDSDLPLPPLHLIEDYELIEEIARGGMGVVYKARQKSLNRTIALKMILTGKLASKQDVQRFRAEAQAAANLHHPNIVAVHEFGEQDGHHYFSMDYIAGKNLAELVKENPIPPEQAVRYVRQICEAIQYAHQQGVVHRDLKPSNVLIDAEDHLLVTDFGLAKRLTGASDLTLTGQLLGSLNYVPPEQARGEGKRVGPSGDVYSLGAILYFLITGCPPFLGESLERTLNLVLNSEPVAPNLLNPSVPTDLETICIKCLQKEPKRRYASAKDFADDLGRFERQEPIRARPIGATERAWCWAKRNPALAATSATSIFILVIGLLAVFSQWRRAEETLIQMERQHAEDLLAKDQPSKALAYLAHVLRKDPGNRAVAERIVSILSDRSFALPLVRPMIHQAGVNYAEFSPDGRQIVTASDDHTARIWDAEVSETTAITLIHEGPVVAASFSTDGEHVVTASKDKTARIWDAGTGHEILKPLAHEHGLTHAEFSPDGTKVITASEDGTVQIWDAISGEPFVRQMRHNNWVRVARFSPDGRFFVTAAAGRSRVYLIDAENCRIVQTIQSQISVADVDFSIDGTRLAIASKEPSTASIWRLSTAEQIAELPHMAGLSEVVFSPNGELVATASWDQTVRLWDGWSGEPLHAPFEHRTRVMAVKFSSDGNRLVTIAEDDAVYVWDLWSGHLLTASIPHAGSITSASFGPNNDRIVTTTSAGISQIWDIRPGDMAESLGKERVKIHSVSFSPDGARLATGLIDGDLIVWDTSTCRPLSDRLRHGEGRVRHVAFSPDQKMILSAGTLGIICGWDAETYDQIFEIQAHNSSLRALEFSPDGSRFLSASFDPSAQIWESRTGLPLETLPMAHATGLWNATFSNDGQWLATASDDNTARVWNSHTGEPITPPLSHDSRAYCVAFNDDRSLLVTGSQDKTARVWELPSGRELRQFVHSSYVVDVELDPAGKYLATASIDNVARIWELDDPTAPVRILKHESQVRDVDFSLDGNRVGTSSYDGSLRLWDVSSGLPIAQQIPPPNFSLIGLSTIQFEFSPDGRRYTTDLLEQSIGIWETPNLGDIIPVDTLTDLAEAVATQRLAANTNFEPTSPDDLWGIRAQADSLPGSPEFHRWLSWFFADRNHRPINTSSPILQPELIERLVEHDTLNNLTRALILSPTNGLALARLVRLKTRGDEKEDRFSDGIVDRMSLMATQYRPENAEVWRVRARVLADQGKLEQGLTACSKAVQFIDDSIPKDHEETLLLQQELLLKLNRPSEAQLAWLRAKQIPHRDPSTSTNCLDLSPHFNAALKDDWHGGFSPGYNLSTLPTGRMVYADVEFDVRGIIQLSSPALDPFAPGFPSRVDGIAVARKCGALQFLHATTWGRVMKNGSRIGSYLIHYVDGRTHEIPIIMNEDLLEWRVLGDPVNALKNAQVAWRGRIPIGDTARLFFRTWTNPRPDVEIKSLDFICNRAKAAPFLIAITAKP